MGKAMQLCVRRCDRPYVRGNSVVSDFDLICGNGWMLHLANLGFFMGWLAGSQVFSWLADEFGELSTASSCN